jgi:hypothetical protein
MDNKALEKAGFKHDDELKSAHEEAADKNEMHKDGPYVVRGVWKKGLVTLLFEQNTAAEPMGGGMNAIIQHPAVCVVSSPKGRVACNADDTELILSLAADLS